VHVIMSCHKLLALITMIRNVILHLVHMKFLIRSLILDLYLPLVGFLLHHHLLSVGVLSVKPPCLFCSKCYTPLNKPLSYVCTLFLWFFPHLIDFHDYSHTSILKKVKIHGKMWLYITYNEQICLSFNKISYLKP
jgi:hypothetical protein